jgi:hypothetical protein
MATSCAGDAAGLGLIYGLGTDPEIDLALSAVLACAISGDPAAAVVLSSALRRRFKKFEHCRELSLLWLEARF